MADKIRKLKDFGRSGRGNDIHDIIGFNFKFTDLQAVIGIEQMKKLSWRVKRKKEILLKYKENLKGLNEVSFLKQDLSCTTPWFIDILAEDRDELMTFLKTKGIGSRPMYPPINKQKAYNLPGLYPVSDLIGNKGLWLPSASQLKDSEILRVTEAIFEFYYERARFPEYKFL